MSQDFIEAEWLAELGERVVSGEVAALQRDMRDIGTRGARLMHVARGVEGIPGDGRETERRLEVDVTDHAYRVVHGHAAVGATLDGNPQGQREIRAAQHHVRRRLVESEAAGDAHFLHFRELAAQTQAQLRRHETTEAELAGGRWRRGEDRAVDVTRRDAGLAHGLQRHGAEHFVIKALGHGASARCEASYGCCSRANDRYAGHGLSRHAMWAASQSARSRRFLIFSSFYFSNMASKR